MPFIIHRKPPYRLYIEEGREGAKAHVAELPGAFAVGSNAAKAAAAAPGAITAFLEWLRAHHEPMVPEAYVSRPSMADVFVSEVRTEGAPLQAGTRAELFEFDTTPWDDPTLERTLRWLTYSRSDLLSRIEGMTDAELKVRQVAPGRTPWDTLWHVANAEYGYARRISRPLDEVTEAEPAGVSDRLALVRRILEREARAVPPEKRGEIVYPTWANRPDEPWTLQKALRRALEHEREHLQEL